MLPVLILRKLVLDGGGCVLFSADFLWLGRSPTLFDKVFLCRKRKCTLKKWVRQPSDAERCFVYMWHLRWGLQVKEALSEAEDSLPDVVTVIPAGTSSQRTLDALQAFVGTGIIAVRKDRRLDNTPNSDRAGKRPRV